MKTAFGSVVYKAALKYAGDFTDSLNRQTCPDFDILLINDDLQGGEKEALLGALNRPAVIVDSGGGRIFETRIRLLLEAKARGCDLLVIGDFDDRFSDNRVEEMVRAAKSDAPETGAKADSKKTNVFYYNSIRDFSGKPAFLAVPKETADFRDILEYNYLGLGNAAVRVRELSDGFLQSLYQGDTPVFDWYLFTRLLLAGYAGKYVERAVTCYRIHENNLAGLPGEGREAAEREMQVKLRHYRLLRTFHREFEQKLREYEELDKKLKQGITLKTEKNRQGYWWDMLRG